MSGKRPELLINGQTYHVLNRSVAKEEILKSKRVLTRALELIDYYRFPQKLRFSYFRRLPTEKKGKYLQWFKKNSPLVEIYAFSFMPNHYHLLLRQLSDEGIKKFIANFQNGLAKYLNLLFNRHGPAFQGPFKAKRITTEEELLHVNRYIHLNPVTSLMITLEELEDYPWTSYPYYLMEDKNRDRSNNTAGLVNTSLVLGLIGSRRKYRTFVADQKDYQRKLHLIKYLTIE